MEGFLKFIMILILIWLGFSLFIRYVFPRLLIYWVKRKQKKMMEQMGMKPPDDEKAKKTREGDVSIDKVPQKGKKGSTDNMGEYVDFEELDE
ncbi:MAG TPA: DUF4834 family protein [Bacteroidales bacterium]|nr:DUF4834 family protein [Bacteroidales bacterium]